MKCIISKKLGVKSNKCKFVGYPKEFIGYYFYDHIEKKMFVLKHTTF
jgi:hypothetical protein